MSPSVSSKDGAGVVVVGGTVVTCSPVVDVDGAASVPVAATCSGACGAAACVTVSNSSQ